VVFKPLDILALLALVLIALLIGLSIVSFRFMARKRVRRPERIEARLLEKGEIKREWIDAPWVEASLASPCGYALSVRGLPGTNGRLVILHHGITWNWMAALKYAAFLHEAGYSVALFDARGHGDSGGKGTSFGIFESRDLAAVADWARACLPSDAGLSAFGVSLGAASVLEYAPLEPGLVAVVADCSFSSADRELDYHLARLFVPAFLRRPVRFAVDFLCRKLDGFSLRQASPERAALKTGAAILFIHGLGDDYVPTAMSEAMAEARRERRPEAMTELFLVPGAGHAKAHRADPEAYEAMVLSFLDRAYAQAPVVDSPLPLC
jgi:pimeloyl-ACP methyl ester carboxylesterase